MHEKYISKTVTFFDTPFRSTPFEIEGSRSCILKQPVVIQMLEGFPELAVILDSNRQIVAYNKSAESILIPDERGSIYGQRVGEALRCIHAFELPAGCGTSRFCSECGAGKCNKSSRETLQRCSEECRITVSRDDVQSSLDLKVFTSVIVVDSQSFTLFTIEDIQDEKRRKVLENIFFHDVLNTASAIQGIAEIIKDTDNPEDINEFKDLLYNSSEQLIKEIESQRDLINAEQGNLSVNIQPKSVNEIISNAFNLYRDHDISRDLNYSCEFLKDDIRIETDPTLLIRSLSNLIKNALEASNKNGVVKVYSTKTKGTVSFNVNNDLVMPENIKMQIFQRSFSTKAKAGRGIGTYSVKLIVEHYLKGKVNFLSNDAEGTTFTIQIPHLDTNH